MYFSKINDMKISSRLLAGFGLMVSLTLVMGAIALYSIGGISDLLNDLVEHPFQVLDRSQRVKTDIIERDRFMIELMQTPKPETVAVIVGTIHELDLQTREHLELIRQLYLGSKDDVARLSSDIDAIRAIYDRSIALKQAGRQAEAWAIFQPEGEHPSVQAQRDVQKIIDFAREKSSFFLTQSSRLKEQSTLTLLGVMIGLLGLGGVVARVIALGITRPLETLRERMAGLAAGNLQIEVPFQDGNHELAVIARTVHVFKESAVKLDAQRWVKSSVAELSVSMQSAATVQDFAQVLITGLATLCGSGVGIFYLARETDGTLEVIASYGLKKRRSLHTEFKPGEGLVGQAALERKTILLTEVPDDYARITTGIGEATPRQILVAPVLSKDRVLAVVELGVLTPFNANQENLIDDLLPVIRQNLEILERNRKTQELLVTTQQQAEELRTSEEELRTQSELLQSNNVELRQKSQSLQDQTEELRASGEELRAQREQLQEVNAQLEKKSRGLAEQAMLLEKAKAESDKRALERDTASRYKSEFLSNMSHELRTPLNSLLILARSLRDNENGNLTPDDVESASIIHDSGSALLRLINDILDLSKVEAGKMEVIAKPLSIEDLANSLRKRFRLMAETKGLSLAVEVAPHLPPAIHSDAGKIDQILNNLVGNAIKFTEHGSVTVNVKHPTESSRLSTTGLAADQLLEIEIKDTGIGIASDKLESIFNAFEQVDGTASRRYGGTGLGLTISRRLAQFLGGDVFVSSQEGQGSSFSLILPFKQDQKHSSQALPASTASDSEYQQSKIAAAPTTEIPLMPVDTGQGIEDDRHVLTPRDESILVIEDDEAFAKIVRDLSRRRGFKCLVAHDGHTGLELARHFLPTGIVLDIGLPGVDGWSVMEQLKQRSETRHIPVHFMSATDSSQRGLEMGAVGYLTKPVNKEQIESAFERIRHFGSGHERRLLLVEDDLGTRKSVNVMLDGVNVDIVEEPTGEGALLRLRRGEQFDCMILDLGLPGIGGVSLLEQCTRESLLVPPVVVYSARDLSDQETLTLKEYTDSIVIKGARSPERLIDEVTLFLHSVQSELPSSQQRAILPVASAGKGLVGRTLLVVDDDMRNAFALSKVLRARGLKVLIAQDGQKALNQLDEGSDIDVVLMDIMMPGMDGYTAIKEIRNRSRFQTLPVIALTAKAMIGDREKCIQAGANDYLSKPVDIDALLAMLRVQLRLK